MASQLRVVGSINRSKTLLNMDRRILCKGEDS